jgi:gamma-glutamyltranspeptidase/glutathione hydrolase
MDVFRRGGNAFDVAVAAGFVLAVVHPQAGNIGGGGFAIMRVGATGAITALDFRETAPMAASETMYLDSAGAVIAKSSTLGALSAGTPGTVAGLHEIWKQYGSLPWSDLVLPSAEIAGIGFALDDYQAEWFNDFIEELSFFEETASIYLQNGDTSHVGDRLVLKDLARTLHAIAAEERDGFYTGTVAALIDSCMQRHGGRVTLEDLAQYQPVWREPTRVALEDGYEVYSMPPPSSGGIAVGQILKLLDPFGVGQYGVDSPQHIHLFCEAARLVFADRATHLGDPDFYNVPSALIANDDAYIAQRRQLIDPEHAGISADVSAGNPAVFESDQTTHISVCDDQGNMVSLTYTLNANYGSKLVVDGAGFLLNNEMDDFSIKPGVPNVYGLIGGEANKIAPGKRMLSSMSPTIVLKHGEPFAILGTGGGSKIITAIAQAILGLTEFGMDPDAICAQPRFHHQWLPDILYLEEESFDSVLIGQLQAYGHIVKERTHYGDLQVIVIDDDGRMTPASDPGRRGVGGGY